MTDDRFHWPVTVPAVWAVAHVSLCIAIASGLRFTASDWPWFPVFVVDFPLSILLAPLARVAPPLLVFGVLGTAWWIVLGRGVVYLVERATRSI